MSLQRGTSPNWGVKTHSAFSIWRLQFQSYHDCQITQHVLNDEKAGQSNFTNCALLSPKNQSVQKSPIANMQSGQQRFRWQPELRWFRVKPVNLGSLPLEWSFISASSIIIVWVTSLALAPLQSQLAVDQHTSKSMIFESPNTKWGNLLTVWEPSSCVLQRMIWKNHLKAPFFSRSTFVGSSTLRVASRKKLHFSCTPTALQSSFFRKCTWIT